MLRTKELDEVHARSRRRPCRERLHLAIAWRLKWTANPSAVNISVPRMLASCRSGRPALILKGLAGSSTAFESRFNTPASHAFANRERNVSTIRAADGLWILAACGETAKPTPDRTTCRTRAAVISTSCPMAFTGPAPRLHRRRHPTERQTSRRWGRSSAAAIPMRPVPTWCHPAQPRSRVPPHSVL